MEDKISRIKISANGKDVDEIDLGKPKTNQGEKDMEVAKKAQTQNTNGVGSKVLAEGIGKRIWKRFRE